MIRRRIGLFGSLLVLIAATHPAPIDAQVIEGVLLEEGRDRFVSFGSLALLREDRTIAVTSETELSGRFSLEAPEPGAYYLYATALGYRTTLDGLFELGEGDTLRVEFRIPPDAVPIDSLAVTVAPRVTRLDRSGFYERKRFNVGLFITEDEIAKSDALEASDIFRMKPGVRLSAAATSRFGFSRNRVLLRNGCVPMLYIDGMLIRRAGEGTFIDDFVKPEEISGIEVYRGSSEIPLQYGGTLGTCGVILVWTH